VLIISNTVYAAYLAFHFYSHSHLFKDNVASTRHAVPNPLRPMRSVRNLKGENLKRAQSKSSTNDPFARAPLFQSSPSLAELHARSSVSPYASASDVSLPLTAVATSCTLINPSHTSSELVYGRSTAATPSPTHECTVRLVRTGTPVPATQLPHDTRHPKRDSEDDPASDTEYTDNGQAAAEQTFGKEEPQLSYPMTVLVLVVAGVVRIFLPQSLVTGNAGAHKVFS
jgi:hypothetical protein